MSSVFEEIITSSVGFIIAMVILVAVIGGGLYGYWVYADHQTLQNYLWPVAEVLPYQGEYFLGIVNTGHEPFTIKQIYLKGGGVLTPNQAANPNLNWCSATNTELVHNQWWCGEVNQLPVAVMVCSALDPQVCSVVPVHGWQVVTFSQPNQPNNSNNTFSLLPNCPVTVIVSDPYNATWQVTWSSQSGTSGSRVGSTTDRWCVIPNSPGVINFQASVTNNPNLYTCWVNPQQTWVNYTGAPVGAVFNVECAAEFVYVNVNDPYNAGWNVSSISTIYINPKIQKGSVYATITGSSSVSNQILPIPLQCTSSGCSAAAELTASITSNPTNPPYTCSINPSYVDRVTPGGTYNFAVSCTPLFIYVNVLNDTYHAGWEVETVQSWNCNLYSCSPVPYATISGDTDVNNEILPVPPPPTLNELSPNVVAQITSNPIGYVCTINPGSLTASYGGTYSFTVDCNVAPIKVKVEYTPGTSNVDWLISWSGAATGSQSGNSPTTFNVYPGENATVYFTAEITSIPSIYKSCAITPNSTTAIPGDTVTFTVDCTPNYFVYVTVTGDQYVTNGTARWEISSSVYTLIYNWNVANWTLPIGGPTDWLYAQILSCPSHYTCSINPSSIQVTNGSYVKFKISMQWSASSNDYVYITVTGDTCGADWQITSSNGGVLTGTSDVSNDPLYIDGNPSVTLDASILSGNATISPTNTTAKPGQSVTFTVSCSGSPPPPPPGGNNYFVYVTVTNDTLGAGWQVSSSVASITGMGNVSNKQLQIGGQTDTLTAQITSNPSGYTCTISPGSTQATNGSTYTFTVSCVQSNQTQPPQQPCTVEPPSVSSFPNGAPQPSSSANVSLIPYNQTETVTFTYNAPESGNNYKFQYWNIGGQTYQNNVVNITETLTCTTPGGTLTGPSGTAYYQYQPPGGVKIDPDTIDLNQTSETYTFTWTSAWSGTGTLTWNISGLVFIYYNSTPAGLVVWSANVTLPNGIIAAQGSGFLKITNYPQPSNPLSFYVCVVGGYGTVNDVDVNQGSAKGTVYIACELY